jgi:hypothetical protein
MLKELLLIILDCKILPLDLLDWFLLHYLGLSVLRRVATGAFIQGADTVHKAVLYSP